jgi:hypothetical protein
MLQLGLSRADLHTYLAGLAQSHVIKVTIRVLDQDEKPIGHLSAPASDVTDGGVTVDANASIDRQLQLTIIDAHGTLRVDPDSPRKATIFPNRFVQVIRSDFITELDDWVDCPVFRGPITKFERTGATVELEAMGKESLALKPNVLWHAHNFLRGERSWEAIRTLMGEMGETRFALHDQSPIMAKPHSYGRGIEAWRACKAIAGPSQQLFYDARGRVRVREYPTQPVFTFTDGDDGTILGDVSEVWDFLNDGEFWNAVTVVGKKSSKKGKTTPKWTSIAPADHPLSPVSLARNGKPRYVWNYIEDSTIIRVDGRYGAKTVADSMLTQGLELHRQLSFETLPIPNLEPRDVIQVDAHIADADLNAHFRLLNYVIPLTAEGRMTIGQPSGKAPDYEHRPERKEKKKSGGDGGGLDWNTGVSWPGASDPAAPDPVTGAPSVP